MEPPERSPERDAVLPALLDQVPWLGWTRPAVRAALAATGGDPADAGLLFPGGSADLVEAFCDYADRRMEEGAAALGLSEMRLSARVRAVIALRFAQCRPHKEAIRRGLAVLARPGHATAATRCTARTVDAIWHAVGDEAADFSWYTKRATLAAIYGATLLFWLRDDSDDDGPTLEFLDRRLAGLGRIGKLRGRLTGMLRRRPPPGQLAIAEG